MKKIYQDIGVYLLKKIYKYHGVVVDGRSLEKGRIMIFYNNESNWKHFVKAFQNGSIK